ncbi:MAG: hypothetical protein GXP08_03390 [Gammaproteobacteria bacterium]|nr:hypothetical protein [Gammaproteobacteria bacterium]
MKLLLIKLTRLVFLCVTVIVMGCNAETPTGPVFSGEPIPAVVDADNVNAIAVASIEGTQKAIDTTATDMRILAKVIYQGLNIYTGSLRNRTDVLPMKVSIPAGIISRDFCGGTLSTSNLILPGFKDATFEFQEVCYENKVSSKFVINGHVQILRSATSFTLKFIEFAISRNDETRIINYTISCEDAACFSYSDFFGSDGEVYRVSDLNVSGDNITGYTVSATLFHPVWFVVLKTTAGITFNCENARPDAGTLEFTGEKSSSGSITFRGDCTGYDGHYNDGVNSEAFSGNWP